MTWTTFSEVTPSGNLIKGKNHHTVPVGGE